ncbi:MAG: type II toxin-antitoxin system HicB family antitoxin [Fimbriimonadaceae bacterium]
MKLKVVIEPGEQSGFVAHVPALPGCWSQGATREEALDNIREAAEGWLEAQQDRMERTDPPARVELIQL